MSEANKALVRRYYQEVMGDLAGIDEIVAADFVDHHFPPEMPAGPEGVRKFFTEFARGLFSDMRVEIDFLLAEGAKVDCHFVFFARHTGDFGDVVYRLDDMQLPDDAPGKGSPNYEKQLRIQPYRFPLGQPTL